MTVKRPIRIMPLGNTISVLCTLWVRVYLRTMRKQSSGTVKQPIRTSLMRKTLWARCTLRVGAFPAMIKKQWNGTVKRPIRATPLRRKNYGGGDRHGESPRKLV